MGRMHNLLYRFPRRAIASAATLDQQVIFYDLWWRVADFLCRLDRTRAFLFFETSTARRFFSNPTASQQGERIERAIHACILRNYWHNLWISKGPVCTLPERVLIARTRLEGLENLEAAQAGSGGIIVVLGHFCLQPALVERLRKRHAGRHQIIRKPSNLQGTQPSSDWIANGRQLVRARKTLTTGGLVYMLPDGKNGRLFFRTEIMGGNLAIYPGFATLGVLTGAPILPAILTIQKYGLLRLGIGRPFRVPHRALGRESREHDYVVQYRDWLEDRMRAHPESLRSHRMRLLLFGTDPIRQDRLDGIEPGFASQAPDG